MALTIFSTGSILTSCNSSSEKVAEASKKLDHAKEDYNKQCNECKLESEQKITANENSIEELKEYSKKMKKIGSSKV